MPAIGGGAVSADPAGVGAGVDGAVGLGVGDASEPGVGLAVSADDGGEEGAGVDVGV